MIIKLDNEVEIDETFIGGKNKTPVLIMIERKRNLVAKVVKDTQGETLTPEIIKTVKNTASVYTDEWLGYKGLKRIYNHIFVKHNLGEYVNGKVSTNTIEGFWSILKRGIIGIYHFTSKKHLQKYVDEFVFRYNTRNNKEAVRFNILLQNLENRIRYKELVK